MTQQTIALRRLLLSEDIYATVLLVLAIDYWGRECLKWSAGTFRLEFQDEFGVDIPQANLDKLIAAIAVVTTDRFFTDVASFIKLANVLCGSEFDPTVFDPADSMECAWAITEALFLDPPEPGEEKFADDIRAYLAIVLKEEGFITPPDILKIALDADFSAQVTYDYADDPEMFSGMYDTQKSKTDEVEAMLRGNLVELVNQLKVLPLQHGNLKELEDRVSKLMEINDG